MITQQHLREILDYEPETGHFRWKQKPNKRMMVGQIAGCIGSDRYWQLKIDGQRYVAHRLAWLFVHGELPIQIDHINGCRSDNRLCNLRPATPSQNCANSRAMKNSKLGIRGISKHRRRYRVHVSKGDVAMTKSFYCLGQAVAFAKAKSIELHGEYSGYNRAA